MKKKLFALLLLVVLSLGLIACSDKNEENNPAKNLEYQGESLLVYSGAGLSKAMEDVAQIFQENYGVDIQLNYAGCAQLLGQMEINKKGDVFVGGSMNDAEIALEKGFTEECFEISYHVPAIAVTKGNPAGIMSLEDMAKPGVKLILGDNKSNAIGKKGDKIYEKNGLLKEITANVIARAATVNELVTQISLNQADAALVWADNGHGNPDIEIITIAEEKNIMDKVPACVLSFTEKKDLSQLFVDFLMSEEGKAIFVKHGFQAI